MQTRTCFQCGQNLYVTMDVNDIVCTHCGALNESDVRIPDAIVKAPRFQKVIEFRKRSFWSSQIDLAALNEKIQSLNDEGWLVRSITTSSSLIGGVSAYTLLIELKDEEQGRKVAE